nr:uncharacterized protein LOC110073182 [Pogona vitticeps]
MPTVGSPAVKTGFPRQERPCPVPLLFCFPTLDADQGVHLLLAAGASCGEGGSRSRERSCRGTTMTAPGWLNDNLRTVRPSSASDTRGLLWLWAAFWDFRVIDRKIKGHLLCSDALCQTQLLWPARHRPIGQASRGTGLRGGGAPLRLAPCPHRLLLRKKGSGARGPWQSGLAFPLEEVFPVRGCLWWSIALGRYLPKEPPWRVHLLVRTFISTKGLGSD